MIYLRKKAVNNHEIIYDYQINNKGDFGTVRYNLDENKLYWDKSATGNYETEPECYRNHAVQKILEYKKKKVFQESEVVYWY